MDKIAQATAWFAVPRFSYAFAPYPHGTKSWFSKGQGRS